MSGPEYDETNFPEFLYLEAFRDVRDAVAAGTFRNGYAHYVAYGKAEIATAQRPSPFAGGRLDMLRSVLPPADIETPVPPSPPRALRTASDFAIPYTPPPMQALHSQDVDAVFDPDLYVALNPDLAPGLAIGDPRKAARQAAQHWRDIGQAETAAGQRPTIVRDHWYDGMPSIEAAIPGDIGAFHAETYQLLYPDVLQALGPSPEAARNHWLNHGRLEGRVGPGIAPYRDWQMRPGDCWPSHSASTYSARSPLPVGSARRHAPC